MSGDGRTFFVGDGAYRGDGGAMLQTLWDAGVWRELRNCPGRYSCKSRDRALASPERLLGDVFGPRAPPLADLDVPGKDPIRVARFEGPFQALFEGEGKQQVDALHAEYVAALRELYGRYKAELFLDKKKTFKSA